MIRAKIALAEPGTDGRGKYFSVRLKENLYNEPSEYYIQPKLLVISGVNGNFQSFIKLLFEFGVIDENYRWTFGSGHLVLIGNCFYKSEHAMDCLWLIYALEDRARRKGGYIHYIIDNYEIMNMGGDWRYGHPKYASNTKPSTTPYVALYDGNNELWRWLHTKNIVEKIGSIIFIYGGIWHSINQLNLSITDINNLIRLHYKDSSTYTIFDNKQFNFCNGTYYLDEVDEGLVDLTLSKFAISAIITGHRSINRVASYYNGKVFTVGTDYERGQSEAILVINDNFYKIDSKGKKELIK